MAEAWILLYFGVVFVIAYETGEVMDYTLLSKHCSVCNK